jgi:hypothetical protein
MSLSHNTLITHDLTLSSDGMELVLVNHKELKAAVELSKSTGEAIAVESVPIVRLHDIHSSVHNLFAASVHMYQMIVRNQLGIAHVINEIDAGIKAKAIGPIIGKELIMWLMELQQLNRATRTLVIEGQEAADKIINGDDDKTVN